MKRTWGESLSATFSAGFINFVLSLPGILLFFSGIFMMVSGNSSFGVVLIGGGIVLLVVASLISSAVNAILLAAIYLYATERDVPEYFDRDLIAHSFAGG